MKDERHKSTECAGCGENLDASTHVGGTRGGSGTPSKGDVTLCLYCGQPSRYLADLSLEPISSRELVGLFKAEPDFQRTYEALQERIKERDYDAPEGIPDRR
jgi:hypothetical protein